MIEMTVNAETIEWSEWQPLNGAWLGEKLPSHGGLYRIRRVGFDGVDYIGQTGSGTMTLKKRMAMLKGVWGDQMPYRDPHTAGPALWSLRDRDGVDFEVSVVVVDDTTPKRKGLEALAIALYRQRGRRSPTLNFGRMPIGYVMSSKNNRKLVEAGKRFRGGPSSETNQSHMPGIAPAIDQSADVSSLRWCGHGWSAWQPLSQLTGCLDKAAMGLYRIASSDRGVLIYVGEGNVYSRLMAHSKKADRPDQQQGAVFQRYAPLSCSWVVNNDWERHQRLELETDLIGAHVLHAGCMPRAQFLG